MWRRHCHRLIQDVDGAELFGLGMFLRIARAPAQNVTDSSFVEQGVNQRGRSATEASTSAWADLWRDVWCKIDVWGGLGENLSVRKVKAHITPEAVLAGIITADDRAGNDLADAACKPVLEHRAPPNIREAVLTAISAVTHMAHWIALVGSARQRLDIGSTWLFGRGRAIARQRERERPWPLPLPALPTIWRRGHTFVDSASGRICARCQHPECATCGRCPGAAGARASDAAQRLRLDGFAGTTVDLLQGGKVVSAICVVCGSYGGRVVRKSLLDKCPGTPPLGRRLALRDVLLGFLPGSKRTARLDSVPGQVWTMSHQRPISRVFCPAPFCCSSAA